MKGRPRKPTALLELSGSAKTNRSRLARQGRGLEPRPDPTFGNSPRHLTEAQKEIWKEVVLQIPSCVLTKSDRLLVELTVRLTERMRNGTALASDNAQLMKCLSQLGMTPADRSKIKVTTQDPTTDNTDPFAEFTEGITDAKSLQ